jgi:serine/threonine protein kinase/tetratricopeptide (TPR) repeat protein
MPVDSHRIQAVFAMAVEAADDAARAVILDRECAADDELRRRVEALLRAHDRPGDFLAKPAAGAERSAKDAEAQRTGPDVPAEAQGTAIGPYRLLQKLGEGGMGAVWVAEQREPVKRRVALKVIKPGLDSAQVLHRFEAERQALALMDHTHIAKVLDAGTTDAGRPYFVMELVPGVPITRYCDELHLSVRERLELFIPVCQAIQHAHQKGIIHRDIKPSNVLVCMQDGKPVPKVIDFGVAKALHQRLTEGSLYTEIGAVIGTLEYMSPEQAEMSSLGVDTRTDVYALGVLLYELLTGSTPLDQKRLRQAAYMEMVRLIKEEEPPKPSTRLTQSKESLASIAVLRRTEPGRLTKEVRGELDWVVMKALEKDRSRRYDAASGLARDIERHLHDEPVEACPVSAGYRLRKFVRRHRGPVLAATSLLLLLIAGILGTTWGLVRAERARQEALLAREAEAAQRRLAESNEQQARVAAAAEKQAKETALAKAAETRAVLEFVQNKVFAAARPQGQEGGLGRDVTLRRAIEAVLPVVELSFRQQPVVEALLRTTLGISFLYLGEATRAAEQFQTARTLFAKYLGPDDPNTLGSMNNLANSYSALGRDAEALALREKAVPLMKTKLGPDHRDTLQSMNNLANTLRALGRPAEALKIHEETLALRQAKLGPDHADTLQSMNNLAVMHRALGHYAEALALREQTLAVMKAKHGPNHPDTLASMNNLANSYSDLGRHAEALELLQETLGQKKAALGPDHPDTLLSMCNVAECLVDLNCGVEAVAVIDEFVRRAAGRPTDPRLLPAMMDLRLRQFQKASDHAGCRATADMWDKLKRTDAASLYAAACFRAVTAAVIRGRKSDSAAKEASAETDQAMAYLKQAVAAGYKDAVHMKQDKDLEALRNRDDFKKLVADLEGKVKAGAR